MKKARSIAVALGAAAVAILPMTAAHASTTVGGQSVGAGGCDVTLASVTFDTSNGRIESITVGSVDC